MKGKTKSQTIYDLKRNIRALNYYLENYIKPHEEEVMKKEIENTPMVKQNGYLVIDDCCHKYQIPHGMFHGIESVSKAVDEWNQEGFKELFSVVHIRVFKKL